MVKLLLAQFLFLALAGVGVTDVPASKPAIQPARRVLYCEIENQTPCFLFGGYQLSLGVRNEKFRVRISAQNSGHADFEGTGIDRRNQGFKRDYADGSVSVSVDRFWNDYLFTYSTLASNKWLVRKAGSTAQGTLRTWDYGLGMGIQYYFCRYFFAQFSCHVNYRERESLVIEGEKYTLPIFDASPGLRLGVRF